MRYLNIFLIIVIIGVSASVLAPDSMMRDVSDISHHHSDTENGVSCHCDFHRDLKVGHTYLISCDWSDKLSVKQTSDTRSFSISNVISNRSAVPYIILSSSTGKISSISISPDTPPPKSLS